MPARDALISCKSAMTLRSSPCAAPVAINPEFPLHHRFLAASLAQNGQDVDAHEAMKRYLSLSATKIRTVAAYAALPPLSRHRIYLLYRKHLIEGVTKAGMPEK